MAKLKINKGLAIVSAWALPLVALAQTNAIELIDKIAEIIRSLIPIVIGLALLYFFWGLAQFILKSGDQTAVEEGKRKMIWGIIALFVIVAIWGIVALLVGTFLEGSLSGTGGGAPSLDSLIPDF